MEVTAAANQIGLKEICALALLVPSGAGFDQKSLPEFEPHPVAVALGQKLGQNEAFNKVMREAVEAERKVEDARQELIPAAFPTGDPRRILKDTIFGFAAALVADVSLRLGEADPYSRLARRLSLWFKPWQDFSRYGIPLPHEARSVARAVQRLVELVPGDDAERLKRLFAIWAGDASVEASEDGVREVVSLLVREPRRELDGLAHIVGLEICGALVREIDLLDVDTIKALFEVMKLIHDYLDDGRAATAVFRRWLGAWSDGREGLRLTFDPSETFGSAEYSDLNGDALEPLLIAVLKDIAQRGHSIFPTGPLPIRGVLFRREGPLFEVLYAKAPEAADLHSLLSIDGDYADLNGPFGEHWYWTGEGVGRDAAILPEVIDRAQERGDHALCDMLIGCWTLFCTLFHRAPIPDLVGLAQRINALPLDYRSSTYAVLGLLKREASASEQISRDLDALLSWLPLIETAAPENFEGFMQDLFSSELWSLLDERARSRLTKCEEGFIGLRRSAPHERQSDRLRLLIIDWSAVSETVLRRAVDSVSSGDRNSQKPLGELIGIFRKVLTENRSSWCPSDRRRNYAALNGLDVLTLLNDINKRGGKHQSGDEISWEEVVYVHAGLYRPLRALLEVANNSPLLAKHQPVSGSSSGSCRE